MSPARPDVIVVGERLGGEDHRLRDFLTRAAQPFEWVEAGTPRRRPDRTAGFVLTGPDLLDGGDRPRGWPLERDPLALETSVPGVFAAGDVRHGSTKRVGAAVGDGAMAVALAHRRIEELEAH